MQSILGEQKTNSKPKIQTLPQRSSFPYKLFSQPPQRKWEGMMKFLPAQTVTTSEHLTCALHAFMNLQISYLLLITATQAHTDDCLNDGVWCFPGVSMNCSTGSISILSNPYPAHRVQSSITKIHLQLNVEAELSFRNQIHLCAQPQPSSYTACVLVLLLIRAFLIKINPVSFSNSLASLQ